MTKNAQRLSQLISTFGPGAMIDLPTRSVVVGGLEQWDMKGNAFTTPQRHGPSKASRSSSKWQNEPKFNFKQSHICFSRKPCRFRDPVALAFAWRMPDARTVRASATWGGRESTQRLVPVHHSTQQ